MDIKKRRVNATLAIFENNIAVHCHEWEVESERVAGNILPWIRVAVEKPTAGPGRAKEEGRRGRGFSTLLVNFTPPSLASLVRPADGCFGLNALGTSDPG